MLRFALVASLSAAAPLREWHELTFEQYVSDFGKSYPAATDYEFRRHLFENKLKEIVDHNKGFANGAHTWYAAVNALTDWTEGELVQLKNGRAGLPVEGGSRLAVPAPAPANPSMVDWRERGAVTPVKDQFSCGSCWAFAATEVLESHYAISAGQLLELAPQAMVNCAPNDGHCGGTGGCEGATPEIAFNYTAAKGIPLEGDLPYNGEDGECTAYAPAVTCSGYAKLPANDAAALETALATLGPVAVNVATTGWQTYGGGILSGGCDWPLSPLGGCTLDHVVAVVGYDTVGEGYWLVRNSWGLGSSKVPAWGEEGYIRLSRKNDGKTYTNASPGEGVACEPYPESQKVMGEGGILFDASYPTGVKAAQSAVV